MDQRTLPLDSTAQKEQNATSFYRGTRKGYFPFIHSSGKLKGALVHLF